MWKTSTVTVVLAALVMSGCAGTRIRSAYRDEASRPGVDAPHAVETKGLPPYHAAVTIEPAFLERWAMDAVRASRADEQIHDLIQQEMDRILNARMGRLERQAGPMARRFLDRFVVQRVREVARAPDITVVGIDLEPAPDCNTCVIADTRLDVAPARQPDGPPIPARVVLLLGVSADRQGNRVDVRIAARRVLDLDIDLSRLFPVVGPRLGPVVDRTRARLDQVLAAGDIGRTVPIELAGLESVAGDAFGRVEAVDITVVSRRASDPAEGQAPGARSGAAGEEIALRIGVAFDIAVPPALDLDACSPPDGEDWSVTASGPLFEHVVLSGIREGRVPVRFDGRGRPDPDGAYALHLESLAFLEGAYQIDAHLWHLRFPAWSRWYTVRGSLEVDGAGIVPRTSALERGEGDGFLLLSGLVEKRILNAERLDRTLLSPGSSGGGAGRMEGVAIDRIEIHPDTLCLYGTVAPGLALPSPPGADAPSASPSGTASATGPVRPR